MLFFFVLFSFVCVSGWDFFGRYLTMRTNPHWAVSSWTILNDFWTMVPLDLVTLTWHFKHSSFFSRNNRQRAVNFSSCALRQESKFAISFLVLFFFLFLFILLSSSLILYRIYRRILLHFHHTSHFIILENSISP